MKIKEVNERKLDTNHKIMYFLGFILFLYLFIFSLVLIIYSFGEIGGSLFEVTKEDISPINGFGIGWVLTLIMQSSGAAASSLMALSHAGIIGAGILIFMIIGTRLGTTVSTLFFSLFVSAKRRDFRHGFEVGLANFIYALPIAITMFFMEYFFSFFSKVGIYFTDLGVPFRLGIIDIITKPLINLISFLPNYFLAILGIFILILSLKKIPDFMLKLWDKAYLKKKMSKHLGKKYFSFFAGLIIAILLASTTITITLLIPLIVSRVMNLQKIIPYIIGTNLGGVIDILLGGLIIGQTALPAVFTYVSFSFIGLLWLFKTDWLFKITKYISKRTLHVSRKRALFFVGSLVIIAIILSFI